MLRIVPQQQNPQQQQQQQQQHFFTNDAQQQQPQLVHRMPTQQRPMSALRQIPMQVQQSDQMSALPWF